MLNVNNAIQESVNQTIQSGVRGATGNVWVVNWLARTGTSLSPWWSTQRDLMLRDFWKKSDHLSGALYTMESKMTAIPFTVEPPNRSDRDDIKTANNLTDLLIGATEFGAGWIQFYSKFNEELLSQDNGVFAEIVGPGDPAGPIMGMPTSVVMLDSSRCTRTGNPIYPVVYDDVSGRRYKLHFSRVMFSSQMTSPIAEMNGVGFCAISRAINVSQTLIDILVYKQEKLGSRPHRQILITKGGLDPEDLQQAFTMAEGVMDGQGLTRYSKVVVGGSSSIPDAGVDIIELSKMPDGFDEETSITLGMSTIALAFGVDARELFPAMTSGATRADALLQHLKQRGKGPGQILQTTEQLFNYKFLPSGFKMRFDFQDDAEDRQRAEIRKIRADRRSQDMATETITERILREQMVEDGEVSQQQFEHMEAESGRTPDGTTTLSLFYSRNPDIKKYLDIGVEEPLDVSGNDPLSILDAITDQRSMVLETLANSQSETEKWNATLANSALTQLEILYLGGPQAQVAKPGGTYVDPRVRTENPGRPTSEDMNQEQNTSDASTMPNEDSQQDR